MAAPPDPRPNTELQHARLSCPIPASALPPLLLPAHKQQIRNRLRGLLRREPLLDLHLRAHLNQTQHLHRSLRLTKRLLELRDQQSWTAEELRMAIMLCDEPLPITLHESAFMSMIESQGDAAQKAEWLERCARYEVVGCYAQTEMAHGSNVQGLLTTARYTSSSSFSSASGEDDIITVSSGAGVDGIKWWIGGAGVLATHALIQAILVVDSKPLGPHLFIIPLRDLTTHLPLPGVTIGDIGPKAYGGFSAIDNAYIRLDNVRIPRRNMLMGFAKLSREGKYTPAVHDKVSYGSMVALRAAIPENVGWGMAKAITTAIRYCIERRQFRSEKGDERETSVIRYSGVRHRLIPILATTYAYILSGRRFYEEVYTPMLRALVDRGDASLLGETHLLSTAVKVVTTKAGAEMIECARRTMGGHGFSWLSGVGGNFANLVPAQTYEGENYVIGMQTARGVAKHLAGMVRGRLVPGAKKFVLPESTRYLECLEVELVNGTPVVRFPTPPVGVKRRQEGTSPREHWLDSANIVKILSLRCAYLASQLPQLLAEKGSDISNFSYEFTLAHGTLWIITTLLLTPPSPDRTNARYPPYLQNLLKIYALHHLVSPTTALHLLQSHILTPQESLEAQQVYDSLIEMEAGGVSVGELVGFVDAFGFEDWEVGVMGGKEGGVYERMWEEVRWRETGVERRTVGIRKGEEEGAVGLEERRALMKELEGATWEGVREQAKRVLGHWKEGRSRL